MKNDDSILIDNFSSNKNNIDVNSLERERERERERQKFNLDQITKVELNEIYNVDCIGLIKKIKSNKLKVDAIITDPPYNVSRENNFNTIGREIDFGKWDWGFNQTKWIKNIYEIVKDGGSVIIFNDWKNMGDISKELEKQGFEVKDLIRWIKKAPMPRNTSRRYVSDAEYAIWAVKPGEKWTFNKNDEKSYLRPEIKSSVPMGRKRIHPTQKSKEVIKELIEIHTNKGDVIFDPFSGSGEISLNSSKMDRFFIGSEIDKTYWKQSRKRIDDTLIKPAINHLGNKFRMIKKLLSELPIKNIENFVDVFAGSSVVSASYKSANKYFINDGDEKLASLIELLSNSPDETYIVNSIDSIVNKYELNKIPYKEGYNRLKEHYNKNQHSNKAKINLLVLVLFGFNQQIRFNKKGDFNIPPGKTMWTEYQKEKISKFIIAFKNKKVQVRWKDFEDFIEEVLEEVGPENTIFYFDPPYLLSDATYNKNWNTDEEKRLINCLIKLDEKGYKWVLSNVIESKGVENKELLKLIEKLNLKEIEVNINYKNSNYQRRKYSNKDKEVIIKNFENGKR
ncbi:MAG: hypothetical protein TYPL_0500 [Candidatus Tyloplasma litorale]|nr:MAG: hypothetical protein TYPL_0500 [Mycoplasmatales bacterium]